jgi:hypothetical protein
MQAKYDWSVLFITMLITFGMFAQIAGSQITMVEAPNPSAPLYTSSTTFTVSSCPIDPSDEFGCTDICFATVVSNNDISCPVPTPLIQDFGACATGYPVCGPTSGVPCIAASGTAGEYPGATFTSVTQPGTGPGNLALGNYLICGDYYDSETGGTFAEAVSNTLIVQHVTNTLLPRPQDLIKGASSNVLFNVSGFGNGVASTFGSEVYTAYMFPNPAGPHAPGCPASISTMQTCNDLDYETGTSCYSTPTPSASSCGASWCNSYNYTPRDLLSLDRIPGPNQVNLCEYTGSSVTNAVLAANAVVNVTPTADSYGLTLVPSVAIFPEGATILLKSVAEGTYQSSNGAPPDICNSNYGCFMEFGTPSSGGCTYVPPSAPTTPGYFSGTGELSFNACPYITSDAAGTAYPSSACVLYNEGLSYLNTYQNQVNETYTQPLSTQYLGTGNYIICAYDYQNILYNPADIFMPRITISPFFATMMLNCSKGFCTASPTLQQVPAIPCPTCVTTGKPGSVTAYNSVNIAAFGEAVCGIYGTLSSVLLVFALMLMLLGAVIYSGSSLLPAQTRGIAQNYAFGFIFVGIIATVISALSIYSLSLAGNTSVSQVLALCT